MLHPDALQVVRDRFVDQLIRFDDFLFLFDRIYHGLATNAPDNASGQIDDFFIAFIDRLHGDAINRSTIHLVDDYVLRRIYEFAREITRIGRLQRRIGQTFTSAVS